MARVQTMIGTGGGPLTMAIEWSPSSYRLATRAVLTGGQGCLTISTSGTVAAGFGAGFDFFIIAAAFALMS